MGYRRVVSMSALISIVLAGSLVVAPVRSLASSAPIPSVKLLTCSDSLVVRPVNFVITCADGYTSLRETHWTMWGASSAIGTTDFAMNLCRPYCAASPMSYFRNSVVRLYDPESTKHGRLFSALSVRYVLKGTHRTFRFSWKGDPSF